MRKLVVGIGAVAALILASFSVLAAPAQANSVPSCQGPLLKITHTRTEGATGHSTFVLRMRNISQATCDLRGYPGLDALGKHGKLLGHAHRTLSGFNGGAKKVKTIVLDPNQVASARVEWHNFNFHTGGDCKLSKKIATTAPNTKRTVKFAVVVSLCDLEIHPTVGGFSGNS